jgi:alpha-1,2-mannosyltransferase
MRRGFLHYVLFAIAVAAYTVHSGSRLIDLDVYRAGAHAVLEGDRLYDLRTYRGFAFTYPPFAALVMLPLGALPWKLCVLGWTAVNAAACLTLWRLSLRTTLNIWVFAVALLSCVYLEPIWQNIRLGQASLFLVLVVVYDLLRPSTSWGRGTLTGLAIGVKLTPAVFLVLLVVTKQWAAVRNCLIGFGVSIALAWAFLPTDSGRFWLSALWNPSRIGDLVFVNNQSVMGALLRAYGQGAHVDPAWLVLSLSLVASCLALAKVWWIRDEPVLALGLTGLSALFASPVSWTHHWAWCIPLGCGLFTAVRRVGGSRPLAGVVAGLWFSAFVIAPNLHVPRHDGRELHWTLLQAVAGSTYLWMGALLLAFAAVLARVPAAVRSSDPEDDLSVAL